jgi:hypothetical protein
MVKRPLRGRKAFASRLLAAAALGALILAAPAAYAKRGSGGDDIDDKIDDKVDKKVEDKVDDRIDRKVDDKVDSRIDDKVDGKVDDKLDGKVDDKINSGSGRSVEDRLDDRAAEQQTESSADRVAARAMEDRAKEAFDRNLDAADAAHKADIETAKDVYDAARRIDGADEAALKAEFEAIRDAADATYNATKDSLKADYEAARDQADTLEDAAKRDLDDANDEAPARRIFEAELDEKGDRRTRGEWLMLVDPGEAAALARRGYRLEAVEALPSLGAVLMRASVAVSGDIGAAEAAVRADAPGAGIDYNHLYYYHPAADVSAPRGVAPSKAMRLGDGETGRGLRIGVIDTRVDAAHEALAHTALTVADFVPYDAPRPADHGTSVVSIIAGKSAAYQGLAPEAEIFEASVFFAAPDGGVSATTESIVKGIDWLAQHNVSVINLSLAGPPNEILKGAVARAQARGVTVVAAVGNEGPSARPLFPAADEGVSGVTAVTEDKRVYRLAGRGDQVDFAAPGVGVLHADGKGGYAATSGTSIAAPFVATVIAAAARDGKIDPRMLEELEASAEDLGARGRDPVYGYGLIRPASNPGGAR